MRHLAWLLLLAPALAQGQTPDDYAWWWSLHHSTTALSLPLTQSGTGFDCTGSLSCLSWNGSALVESGSAGMVWTQNGTVPQVAANALPTTASTGAAGPFSDANYYSSGTGSDPLDSAGDRFGCAAFNPTTVVGVWVLISNGLAGTSGYYVTTNGASVQFTSSTPGLLSASAPGLTAGGLNVACWWRTIAAINSKLNLGTTVTNAAAGTEVSGTAYSAKVGRFEGVGNAFPGTILHIVQGLGPCPTPPAPFAATCEGWATYQMTREFGLLGTRGERVTFTRATVATNEVNGTTWNVPGGAPRVTTQGLLVERAITNIYPTPAAPAAGTATATATGQHYFGVVGSGSQQLSAGTATTTGLPCTATQASPCAFTVTAVGTLTAAAVTGTLTCAQIEAGATRTSCTPAATRATDVATVPTPASLSPSQWCVGITGAPYGGRAWDTGVGNRLWEVGAVGAANSYRLASNTFGVYDATITQKYLAYAAPSSASHTMRTGDVAGTLSLTQDGAIPTLTPGGLGTGVVSAQSPTLYLGNGSTGALAWDGYLRDLRVYRSATCR